MRKLLRLLPRFCWAPLLIFIAFLIPLAVPVKHENFKTCNESGFCKRNRAYADAAGSLGSSWSSPYNLASDSVTFKAGQLRGTILKSIQQDSGIARLPLVISFLKSGAVRVTIDEEKRQKGEIELRHGSQARKERYNEAGDWAIVGGLGFDPDARLKGEKEKGVTRVLYGPSNTYEAVIRHDPFSIDFVRNGETQVQFNKNGLLNIEHWRAKLEKDKSDGGSDKNDITEDESSWWEETFGGNTDSKPRGPESVALDVSFPGYEHVFGIPEHAGPLSLKETRGGDGKYSDPYRLYNLDVFEYELDSPMTLYGSIPFMQAHRKDSTVGIFWLNAAETWVDITKSKVTSNPLSLGMGGRITTQTHWISENGLLDVFVLLGTTPNGIIKTYTGLTGYSQLPPQFSIAYHQCRWNYITEQDVKDVDKKFDKHKIPYDVIWLDIEYTDGKKYFTWDPLTFDDPVALQKHLEKHERKLVAIIDPHIKNVPDYSVVDELKNKGLAVKNKDGNIFEGWCWPGSSHWVDCFNPAALRWWANLFSFDKWQVTRPNLFIWNDMNEPSVFNGPETTMPKDNLHHGNWEHRDLHNINGMTFVNGTYTGLLERKRGELRRPFVLTRAFFAGSQRLGAMWTGDNQASWGHLAASIPMLLSSGISGFPFTGADVGGFFGNPSKELLTRWYQAGAFYPFFRAHAHIDTRRREPYLAGEPYTGIITQALRLRYQLLPAWYTAFHEASIDGSPILRPQYYIFPSDEKGFSIDDQFYIGSTGLLAKPITSEIADSADIYLSDAATTPYYDYFSYKTYSSPSRSGVGSGGGATITVPAPLNAIPLLMRGGHIIPRRDRPRRSSGLMRHDPFTLVVALNATGQASGTLYLDDGASFDYQSGAYIHRRFSMAAGAKTLMSEDLSAEATRGSKLAAKFMKEMKGVRIERIIVVGAPAEWAGKTEVAIREEGGAKARKVPLTFHPQDGERASWAVVRDPAVGIGVGWTMEF